VNEAELSIIPLEARPYQGTTAGVVTRLAASSIDGLVVATALLLAYAGSALFRFLVAPRSFEFPEPTLLLSVVGYLDVLVLYLTGAWSISGRTFGDHIMGIRVVTEGRRRPPPVRAFIRAVLCAIFPVGVLWCAVNARRRSVQDLVVRTSVIYDWLPRPHTVGHTPAPASPGQELPGCTGEGSD
jgi:uncharacterized RDD family membrane protein YckC